MYEDYHLNYDSDYEPNEFINVEYHSSELDPCIKRSPHRKTTSITSTHKYLPYEIREFHP